MCVAQKHRFLNSLINKLDAITRIWQDLLLVCPLRCFYPIDPKARVGIVNKVYLQR